MSLPAKYSNRCLGDSLVTFRGAAYNERLSGSAFTSAPGRPMHHIIRVCLFGIVVQLVCVASISAQELKLPVELTVAAGERERSDALVEFALPKATADGPAMRLIETTGGMDSAGCDAAGFAGRPSVVDCGRENSRGRQANLAAGGGRRGQVARSRDRRFRPDRRGAVRRQAAAALQQGAHRDASGSRSEVWPQRPSASGLDAQRSDRDR